MKKVYIKPDSRTIALGVHNCLLEVVSPLKRNYADSREQRDDRFEDYEDIDDYDDDEFWDD